MKWPTLASLPTAEEVIAALAAGGLAGWLGRGWIAREKRLGADHETAAKTERERERLLAEERNARIEQSGEVQRALVALAESIAAGMARNHETHDAIIVRFEALFRRIEELGIGGTAGARDPRLDRLERRIEALSDRMRGSCPRCRGEYEGDDE